MSGKRNRSSCFIIIMCMAVLMLTGCAAGKASFDKGNLALDQGNYDEAVLEYLDALEKKP